ncbi:DUF2079 domain-containing protein [Thermococcus sp. 21S7]|uniref:DUF2079 domain-containing protein n=1 Tax=Thermococcus sp. 21S7 TaxID=1638221 RepID=UPI0014392763|nr:DUF2079 domain-containing protein [Thermococcus sp. 21S7]NJE60732.1 DUF2079 domain-containing protein [Thermococcus sp. 21S7]
METRKLKIRLSTYDITAACITLAYITLLVKLSFEKFSGFRYSSLDLGIFTQSMSGFLHGRPLFNTVEWQFHGAPNHFGVHFQPIMFLLVPMFYLFPSPKTLLAVQSLALGASVFLAYHLARKLTDEKTAIVLTVLYALNSSLIGINLFEFHPVALAVPLFILATIFLVEDRKGAFALTAIFILSAKEDAFIGVASLSLWWAFREGLSLKNARRNRSLLVMAAVSVLYGLIVIFFVIPHFGNDYLYGGLYSHPSIGSRKILYFLLFNLTFGLLPLLLPRNALLLTLPWLESLLASRPSQTAFGFHYPYMLVPLSFTAAVSALRELELRRILSVLVVVGLMASMATMPVAEKPPRTQNPLIHYSVLEPIPGAEPARPVIQMLMGSNLSVYTQPNFYPALALKENVYVYPNGIRPDAVLVDVRTYQGRLYLGRVMRTVREKYRLVYSREGVRLYVREGLNVSVSGRVPPEP